MKFTVLYKVELHLIYLAASCDEEANKFFRIKNTLLRKIIHKFTFWMVSNNNYYFERSTA